MAKISMDSFLRSRHVLGSLIFLSSIQVFANETPAANPELKWLEDPSTESTTNTSEKAPPIRLGGSDPDDRDDGGKFSTGKGGSDRGPSRTRIYDDGSLEDPDQAAMLAACGLEPTPMGEPFRREKGTQNYVLARSWEWGRPGNRINRYKFNRTAHLDLGYTNPMCELFIMRKLRASGKAAQGYRCSVVSGAFMDAYKDMQTFGGGGMDTSTNVLDSFFSDNRGSGDDANADVCAENGDREEYAFACSYVNFQSNLEGGGRQRQAAEQLKKLCSSLGAPMRPRLSMAEYQMMTNGGIDAFGGGMCGQRGGNGITIIQAPESKFGIAANAILNGVKNLAPIMAMYSLGKMHQQNVGNACKGNQKLGFPCIVTQGGMGVMGGGYGGMYGGGMMGGGIGMGGGIWGGGGCGGMGGGMMGGGCGFGHCGGGCGIGMGMPMGGGFIGGGGMIGMPGGGMMGGGFAGGIPGGVCGMPPYAPWAGGGCNGMGGGIGGVFPGAGGMMGGVPGMGYPWNGGGLGGMGVGMGMGLGGMNGMGMGNPFPGPLGTMGGGNGWGGMSGYPGIGYGGLGGMGGNIGMGYPGMGNPFPGPAGTIGGTNGWGGNPWSANGMYGAPGYAGNGYMNAQYAQAQAQMYQEYAARIRRQEQATQSAAQAYQQADRTAQEAYQKSYQAYMAYSMAQQGYTGAAQQTMIGTTPYMGGAMYGTGQVPSWYPNGYNSTYGSGQGNWAVNFNARNVANR